MMKPFIQRMVLALALLLGAGASSHAVVYTPVNLSGGPANNGQASVEAFLSNLFGGTPVEELARLNVNQGGALLQTSGDLSVTFDSTDFQSGAWTYTQDAGKPGVNVYVLKAGNSDTSFAVFQTTSPDFAVLNTALFDVGAAGIVNSGGNVPALSYLGVYSVVPVPAALPLLATALGLGYATYRRRKPAVA